MILALLIPFRAEAQQNQTCEDLRTVARLGPTTTDDRRQFRTTQDVFRVTYEVDFLDDTGTTSNDFVVEITDRFGLVESDSRDTDGGQSFLVPEDAGTYSVETDVEPENGARYRVVIEECAEDGGNGGGGGNGSSPSEDQYDEEGGNPTGDPNGEEDGDDPGAGEVDGPKDVILGTPIEKPLPNTGGFPLLIGFASLAVAGGLLARRVLRL